MFPKNFAGILVGGEQDVEVGGVEHVQRSLERLEVLEQAFEFLGIQEPVQDLDKQVETGGLA